MSRPIKISDELYQRLKVQADSDGLTLQDALVELITTPHEGLAALETELSASRESTASQENAVRALQTEVRTLRDSVSTLQQRISELAELRNKDVAVFNDWAETWREIPALSGRIDNLERLSHRHMWQDVEEE